MENQEVQDNKNTPLSKIKGVIGWMNVNIPWKPQLPTNNEEIIFEEPRVKLLMAPWAALIIGITQEDPLMFGMGVIYCLSVMGRVLADEKIQMYFENKLKK